MTTLISVFSSLERNSKLNDEYIEQILYNLNIIKIIGNSTDDNGISIDWVTVNGDWKNVSDSIHNILNQIKNKGLGIFNSANSSQFDFVINYFSEYNVQKSIVIASTNFENILSISNSCIFGNTTNTDTERFNLINDLTNQLKNIQAIFKNLI